MIITTNNRIRIIVIGITLISTETTKQLAIY
jgi:hypothetical protein